MGPALFARLPIQFSRTDHPRPTTHRQRRGSPSVSARVSTWLTPPSPRGLRNLVRRVSRVKQLSLAFASGPKPVATLRGGARRPALAFSLPASPIEYCPGGLSASEVANCSQPPIRVKRFFRLPRLSFRGSRSLPALSGSGWSRLPFVRPGPVRGAGSYFF